MVLEFRDGGAKTLCSFAGYPGVKFRIRFHSTIKDCDTNIRVDRTILGEAACERRESRCRTRDRTELTEARHFTGDAEERIFHDFRGHFARHTHGQEAQPLSEETPLIQVRLNMQRPKIRFEPFEDKCVVPCRLGVQNDFEQWLFVVRAEWL